MADSLFLHPMQLAVSSSGDGDEDSPARRLADRLVEDMRRVLIVEDDYLIAMEAEAALSDAGFAILGIAATAEEALALAKRHQPEAVVMDIRLAGQRDGIDAAGDLYRELGLRCIFATAHDDQQTRARLADQAVHHGLSGEPRSHRAVAAELNDLHQGPPIQEKSRAWLGARNARYQ
jgi:DNA-binding NarL/FixJ family response regulator